MNYSVSVIIPVYNEEEMIRACLQTLLNQTEKPTEIIIVDDGSKDKTTKEVKKLQTHSSLIQLFKQEHQGPAQARNLGAKKAKGGILVFADADMEFGKDFLKILTRPINKGRAIGTWSGNEWVKNWDNIWARCWNFNYNRSTARMVSKNSGQKKVFRAVLKSEFDKVKGFDSIGYTDDWTLVSKLGFDPKITTAEFYHHNPDSLRTVFRQARWIGKRQYKLNKIGIIVTLIRNNIIFSVLVGMIKSIFFREPRFLVFKIIYDFGIFIGASESLTGKRY